MRKEHPARVLPGDEIHLLTGFILCLLSFFESSSYKKLANMFAAKTPNAFPTRNTMPMIPFAMNSSLILFSDFSLKIGDAKSRAIPMKP